MLVVELSSVFDGVLLEIKMYILQIFLLGISKIMISDKVFCFVILGYFIVRNTSLNQL